MDRDRGRGLRVVRIAIASVVRPAAADGGRRHRDADRVCERRGPHSRAGQRSSPRADAARRTGRRPRTARPPVDCGKPRAVPGRRGAGARHRDVDRRGTSRLDRAGQRPRRDAGSTRRADARVYLHHGAGDGPAGRVDARTERLCQKPDSRRQGGLRFRIAQTARCRLFS